MKKKEKVFVGMSGGVDSSVSALLLIEQGYDVTGVFIRTWQPDFIECTWRDERRDAMRVCAHLNIPFLECDGEEAYKKGVADYMISEYRKGRTPNPDVMCNKEVKFGVFLNFALSNGADYIATGHYVKRHDAVLYKADDEAKDQVYFLWMLTNEHIKKALFPIGGMKKSEVRILGEKHGIPTAQKKDSQGVCFLGPLDMKEFLAHYIDKKEGDVLSTEGKVIGVHDGALFYTIGERHGFTITQKTNNDVPVYVVSKDIEKNTITVGPKELLTSTTNKHDVLLEQCVWSGGVPDAEKMYTAQIRYHGAFIPCVYKEGNHISFMESEPTLAAGQSVVLYDGEKMMGGGIVV
jgi:tRNA-specific 2-thiouridylase